MFEKVDTVVSPVSFHIFVELLNTAQDILKNSTDMQVCINEAADLAALVMKLKEDHAKELEARDLKHASKLSKMSKHNKNLSANLETVMKNSQE